MIKTIEESPLYTLANPRSIAFFGASNNFATVGTNLLASVLDLGYEGAVYPVHPKEDQIQGLKAYRSALDLPEAADLAVIILPKRFIPQVMDDCGQRGVKRAIIVAGGFKETGDEGAALEVEIKRIAERHGLRFLGPNCLGVANPHRKLNTTWFPFEGVPGFIGLASQSGSFVTQMFGYLARSGLGFSTAFSVGNEASIDVVDCLEYLALCPQTKVIGLYLEGINRGRAFVEAAKAVVPHKPIVALYVGGSESGRQAALSHTGALSGPNELYDGIFRQSGIIRAQTITELFDYCWALGSQPRPQGSRLVIQTRSGGPGATAADAAARAGLELPPLPAQTIERLSPFIPDMGSIKNPVDLTITKNPLDFFEAIPRVLLEEEGVDMLLIYFRWQFQSIRRGMEAEGLPEERVEEKFREIIDQQCTALSRVRETHNKPLIGYSWEGVEDPFVKDLIGRGMPVYLDAERAVRSLAALVEYTRFRERIVSGG